MNTNKPLSKTLALVLSVALVFTMMPFTVSATAAGCTHEHNAECGYVKGVPCGHTGDDACVEDGERCAHDDECGYIEAAPCRHQHDASCGGLVDSNKTLGKSGEESESIIVAEFDEVDEYTLSQGYAYGVITSQDDLDLPDTLTGKDAVGEAIAIEGVTWQCKTEFDPFVSTVWPGYIFSPVLPQGYILADGVTAPEISVNIWPEDGMEINPTGQGDTFTSNGIMYSVLTESGTTGTVSVIANSYTGDIAILETVTDSGVTYTVTEIGSQAFNNCTSLTSITLPDSLTAINNRAFFGCTGLTGSLTIPAGVTTIGVMAFYDCTGFDGTLTIPASVTTIGMMAFNNCTNLTGITSGITDFTNIDPTAFDTIKNKPVTCDPALAQIHQTYGFTNIAGAMGSTFTIGALTYTVLTAPVDSTPGTVSVKATDISAISGSLTLTGSVENDGKTYSVTTIEANAFYGCTGLTGSLTIPSGVTTIGANAFRGCTGFDGTLTIPASVTTIGMMAFNNCTNLTGITSGITDFTNITRTLLIP